MRRAAAALAAAATIALVASGCESTQDLSAKLGRTLGHQSAITATTKIGAANRDVRVARAVLITAAGQSAVALELTNTAGQAEIDFPVLIDVLDAKGVAVYRNNTKGIEASLQQLALLAPHSTAWWVDNEILASGGVPKRVTAAIGTAASAAATVPQVTTQGVSASDGFPGPHVSATVVNRSAIAQSELPVYAVALKDGQVVGAGRGLVPALAAGKSAQVLVPMVGSVGGATISLTVAPTSAR